MRLRGRSQLARSMLTDWVLLIASIFLLYFFMFYLVIVLS